MGMKVHGYKRWVNDHSWAWVTWCNILENEEQKWGLLPTLTEITCVECLTKMVRHYEIVCEESACSLREARDRLEAVQEKEAK